MNDINLTDNDYKQIYSIILTAIKDDHAGKKDGLKEYVDKFSEIIEEKGQIKVTDEQKDIIIRASRNVYDIAKDNYKDTHILGVKKDLGEKFKTAGAMFTRATATTMCVGCMAVGVPLMGIAKGLKKVIGGIPFVKGALEIPEVIGEGLTVLGSAGGASLLLKNYSSISVIEATIQSLRESEIINIKTPTSEITDSLTNMAPPFKGSITKRNNNQRLSF